MASPKRSTTKRGASVAARPSRTPAKRTKVKSSAATEAKLHTYHEKRDFGVTPEPRGGRSKQTAGFGYLIQKHAARRLHYDFRLELDGVLLSWAVPKGPSLSPAERRLAVRTEDHPIEYGDFEGVIPAGEYGGGTVMLWDRGSWTPSEDPREMLRKGHLTFTLHGERLTGRWHLVKTKGRGGEKADNWLLFKGKDEDARDGEEPVDTQVTSIVTGRTMDAIAADRDRTWHSNQPIEETPKKTFTPSGVNQQAKFPGPSGRTRAKRATHTAPRAGEFQRAAARAASKRTPRSEATSADPKLKDLVASIPTEVTFTNLDKVLYSEQGLSKAALIAYYTIVEPWMMPHLANRPVTLVRCPEGAPKAPASVHQTPSRGHKGEVAAAKHCFYQKHAKEGVQPAILRVPILEDDGETKEYMAIADRDGLFAAVQLGSLELHTWGCHIDDVERPDSAVIDLDPDPDLPWKTVVDAAFDVRSLLELLGLECWVKTTGGKGIHVCFPVTRRTEWDDFKSFTRRIAATLEAAAPAKYTTNISKERRKGKIFIDYLRNGRGATAIAPYSTRARPEATVSAPIGWDELRAGARPLDFNVRTMPARLDALKKDPWADFLKTKQSITEAMKKRLVG